ncbi:tetratricopeptide repeat protein [Yoonia sp. 208BN28-4]|uniref:tetratricopeptide repeat protein n=1 Tax=Yoonia sp. 208BN28-4 TaxID=3126505 RepID=UPI0030EC26D6
MLDDLFQELLEADEQTHSRIADRISGQWERSGSAAIDLLYRRGTDALEENEPGIAAEHLTAALDHDPTFAEGYHARASAYYALGMVGPALDDLRQTLVLEPRHFDAMFGFGVLLEELERYEDAAEVYRRIQEIYPLDPEAAAGLERISLQLEGQSL